MNLKDIFSKKESKYLAINVKKRENSFKENKNLTK